MRNLKIGLYASTALVAAGLLAAPASAAEPITITVGGFMEQWVGWADSDGDYERATNTDVSTMDQKSDTEIIFTGSTKLDNGISVSVTVELESDNPQGAAGTNIDQSFMEISSDMLGRLQLGSVDALTDQVRHSAPEVGIENQFGDYGLWVAAPATFTDYGATFWNPGMGNKVVYHTPQFYGFTMAAMYASDIAGGADGQAQPAQPTQNNAFAFAMTYDAEMAGVAIGLDGSWGRANSISGTTYAQEAIQAGVSLGFSGFTIGGTALWLEDRGYNPGVASNEGLKFEVGASYETGPYAVSVNYYQGESEGSVVTTGEDDVGSAMVSGSYNIGPGVDVKGSIFFVDYDGEASGDANDNDGWGLVGGVVVGF